jgi:DNA-binding transcriptional MerR regulator
VARLCGVSTDALRHYESRGLLPGARRSANGYREFPEGQPSPLLPAAWRRRPPAGP